MPDVGGLSIDGVFYIQYTVYISFKYKLPRRKYDTIGSVLKT